MMCEVEAGERWLLFHVVIFQPLIISVVAGLEAAIVGNVFTCAKKIQLLVTYFFF